MLIRIRRTSSWVALSAIEGYRLLPPCSIVAKVKAAVFAIACRKLGSVVSASVLGIAVCWLTAKVGTAGGKVKFGLRSGFLLLLRYRVHQLVSTVSCVRFVSRSFPLDPVAELPGRVRNGSRFTGSASFSTRYALRKVQWVNSSSVLSWMYTGMSSSRTSIASV